MSDILVVCGLAREAGIATGPDIVTVPGGGDRDALEARLAALAQRPFVAVVSFGLAGSLATDLRPGAIVLPQTVRSPDGRSFAADRAILGRWLASPVAISGGLPAMVTGALVGSDIPVLAVGAKRDLARNGAVAVDMESHVAAAYAATRGLPFAALRAISDPADRDLPPIAGAAMRPDGSIDVAGVAWCLLRDPAQLPALIRTGREANRAFRSLRRIRGLLDLVR